MHPLALNFSGILTIQFTAILTNLYSALHSWLGIEWSKQFLMHKQNLLHFRACHFSDIHVFATLFTFLVYWFTYKSIITQTNTMTETLQGKLAMKIFSGPYGDVRLVDGQSQNEGRVEVCLNGAWGTVTDDRWSTIDGQVLCKQLGYSSQGKY